MSQNQEKRNFAKNIDLTNIKKKPRNKIKKIIGVMSGKGGVGKSTCTALLAKSLSAQGFSVGIMDADITGPSIPRLMDIRNEQMTSDGLSFIPVTTVDGIKVVSMNLLLEDENMPVIWRGPVVGNVVKQFYEEVHWGDLDYLLIDMPPGTGDVALTIMQTIKLTGIVMVSVPQSMVSMIVAKAVNMVGKMGVPVLGLIENMSYIECPNCNHKIQMFDDEEISTYLEENNLKLLGELPMTREIIDITHKGVSEVSPSLMETMRNITAQI